MRSCRAQLARHAERRRLRRAQAKAAAEAKRGLELQQMPATVAAEAPAANRGASTGGGEPGHVPTPAAPTPDLSAAPAPPPADETAAAAAAVSGREPKRPCSRRGSPGPTMPAAPAPAPAAAPAVPQQVVGASEPLRLHTSPAEGAAEKPSLQEQQAVSTASELSGRSTHSQLPLQPSMDVLLVAAAAGAQAQAVMAGHSPSAARTGAVVPWALPPAQWPVPAPWSAVAPWSLPQWPAPTALPYSSAPPLPLAGPTAASADLLQLLLKQAASPGMAPSQAQAGAQPQAEQLELLVGAFQAAGEQHLRQHPTDAAVMGLLARISAQTAEQNAAQLQQLLGALTQPL